MAEIPKTIGRYAILELVGRGGMGVLYRARDSSLERDVALKMMLVDFTLDPAARGRFEREAKAVARLQHRNVVTVHELGEADGAPYIVMEFLGGRDLEAIMHSDTPLTLVEKLDLVSQLCEGLGYAHEQGIVHRDIKPGNIRVLEDRTVKILDFGIAKFAVSSVTRSGTILGTPSYMAPEQIMGQPVDGRADLFSAGVLLYELLCGKKPFIGDAPTAVVYQIMHVEPPSIRGTVPDLPEAIEEIVVRALKKNPEERYNRASEMAADLQMVRMMLDLPIRGETSPIATSPGNTATLKLHATMMRPKTGPTTSPGATAMLNTPIRPSALAAAADAAPRADAVQPAGRGLMLGVAALVIGIAVLAGVLALRGGKTPPAEAAPPVAVKEAPAKGAPGAAEAADAFVVSSVPAGARITLNGVDTGKITPAAVPIDSKVPNALELTLKGYKPIAEPITDADLKLGSREFKFARDLNPVRLTVSGGYPFEVLQGGKVVSAAATRHQVTLQPDGGSVTLRSKEYLLNSSIPVDFQRSQLGVTLQAAGTLAVFAAAETCSVIVDGQDLGNPPIPGKPVASGSHTVALKCPDGRHDSQKITVAAGDRTSVRFK
jgi:predicted Ser/Thr protein kinase